MKLLDFCALVDIDSLSEAAKATYLCFYHYKEAEVTSFTMKEICDYMIDAGSSKPNSSRLRTNLTTGPSRAFLSDGGSLKFIPIVLQKMDTKYGPNWNNHDAIESNNEVLDEQKFCGKRGFLDKIIQQINCTYKYNCFDACSVLMRRLFEILLVLSYENLRIDDEIKDQHGNIMMLEGIVNNAVNNQSLKLSRIRNRYNDFRKIGNFSAHGITYTASKKDVDDIKLDYRVMLEELYSKAGLTR